MKRTIILPLICIALFLFIAYSHLGRINKKDGKSKNPDQLKKPGESKKPGKSKKPGGSKKPGQYFSNTDKDSES